MEPITFSIATLATLVAWRSSPVRALIVFFAVLLLYPQYLTLKIGVFDFNTGRILMLVLYAKLILNTRLLQQIQWTWMDRLLLIVFFSRVVALTFNAPLMKIFERESGNFINTCLVYIAVRATIITKENVSQFVSGMVLIAIPLAFVGAYQSVTGHNPMGFARAFDAWSPASQFVGNRYGFYRADVTFGNYITFGLFFAGMLPLSLALYKGKNYTPRTVIVGLILLMGALSSMSSAPQFSIVVSCCVFACYPIRKYWTVMAVIFISFLVFLEFYSNRHFYEVLTRFAMNGGTAAYRIGLYHEAFGGGMDGHWLAGFGYVGIGPGNDNTNFHWEYKDFVNIYIGSLAHFGLMGTLPFLAFNILTYTSLRRAWRLCKSPNDRRTVWCLLATLVGWNVALMTVGTVGMMYGLYYAMTGLAGTLPLVFGERNEPQEAGAPILRGYSISRPADV